MIRYALYYAPPRDSLLWTAGVRWLGRDPETGESHTCPAVPELAPERVAALTAAPSRYGWHATLKAPFGLRDDVTCDDLDEALVQFCRQRRPFPLPRLTVDALGGFLALVPAEPDATLDRLARDCVQAFDDFRAPLSDSDRVRRDPAALTPRQRDHLERWGYPYVMDDFRFHLTLTDRIAREVRVTLAPWLERYFAEALAAAPQVDGIALYAEPAPGAAFRLVRRFGFGG
jgi:putative phosphonate metabolism protein